MSRQTLHLRLPVGSLPVPNAVGELLTRAMNQQGKSVDDVARATKIGRPALRSLLSGRRYLNMKQANALAEALGVNVFQLLGAEQMRVAQKQLQSSVRQSLTMSLTPKTTKEPS